MDDQQNSHVQQYSGGMLFLGCLMAVLMPAILLGLLIWLCSLTF
jgi:hypothetical protein